MTLLQKATSTAVLAITLAVVAESHVLEAQAPPYYGPEAKACKLMPTADLEARFGGTVTNPQGSDGDSSICTVNIHGLAIKLESAPPGMAGVPTSVQQGLQGARMMLGEAKQSPQTNIKDFGKVGCLNMKMTKAFDGKPLTKPLLSTSCFLVDSGYLNMSVARESPKQVSFELVKLLLEKAAAKR
jgi:hypothetical protein